MKRFGCSAEDRKHRLHKNRGWFFLLTVVTTLERISTEFTYQYTPGTVHKWIAYVVVQTTAKRRFPDDRSTMLLARMVLVVFQTIRECCHSNTVTIPQFYLTT